MLNKIAGVFFGLFFVCMQASATTDPYLISAEFVRTYTVEELKASWKANKVPLYIAPVRYQVDLYELVYYTKWHDGSKIKASGLYFMPKLSAKDRPAARMVYHHGTAFSKNRHQENGYNREGDICVGFATDGYAVIFPDYIGLGKGDKFHLFQHADSEAQASIDMLKAAKEFDTQKQHRISNQLFLTGYSQGGHATLATHRKIEAQAAELKLKITASSPMSGAYDMAGVQSEVIFKPYTQPHFLPYLIRGYNEAYKLFDTAQVTIYKSPYKEKMDFMLDGAYTPQEINQVLPNIPKEMLTEQILKEFMNNPASALKKAIEDNSLHNWKPAAPVQLCYCDADEEISYQNSVITHKNMRKLGAKNIRLTRAGRKFNHFQCAVYATMYTKLYFDTFRKGSKKGRKGNIFKRILIGMAK
jgi:Secretory lipase